MYFTQPEIFKIVRQGGIMPPGETRILGGKCGCTCVLNCDLERADTPVCAGGQLSWGSLDLASKGDPVVPAGGQLSCDTLSLVAKGAQPIQLGHVPARSGKADRHGGEALQGEAKRDLTFKREK